MKIKFKYTVIGMIIGILLSCGIGFANNIMLEVEQTSLKYYINGEQKTPSNGEESFIYKDKTYVPIRFVAEVLGKDVLWNGENNSIDINDKKEATSIETDNKYVDFGDDELYTISKNQIKNLKNYSKILSEISSSSKGSLVSNILGVYKDNLFIRIEDVTEYTGDDLVNEPFEYIYKYNLSNDTYEYIANSDLMACSFNSFLLGNKLVIKFKDGITIYDIDTMGKLVEEKTANFNSLRIAGEYMYYFKTSDLAKNKHIVYKQKIGSSEIEKLVELPIYGDLYIINDKVYCKCGGERDSEVYSFTTSGRDIMEEKALEECLNGSYDDILFLSKAHWESWEHKPLNLSDLEN